MVPYGTKVSFMICLDAGGLRHHAYETLSVLGVAIGIDPFKIDNDFG